MLGRSVGLVERSAGGRGCLYPAGSVYVESWQWSDVAGVELVVRAGVLSLLETAGRVGP